MLRTLKLWCLAMLCTVYANPSGAVAQAPADAVKRHFTDDVIAVFHVDLQACDLRTLTPLLTRTDFDDDVAAAMKASLLATDDQRRLLLDGGLQHIYAILRTTDIANGGTSWLFQVAPNRDPVPLQESINHIMTEMVGPDWGSAQKVNGQLIMAASNPQQLAQFDAPAVSRPELEKAWANVADSAVGLIVTGDADTRRVLRELAPELPAPFNLMNGKELAEAIQWISLRWTLQPDLNLELQIQASNQDSATQLQQLALTGINYFRSLPELKQLDAWLSAEDQDFLFDALTPELNNDRLTVSLKALTGDLARLERALARPIQEVRDSARRVEEMNRIRQIGLSLHNYYDAYNQFPASDCVYEGRPSGLSWRVHVLPFLGEEELWKKFKLDEPWDSEHNRALIDQIPEIFCSNDPQAKAANRQGKTTTLYPIAASSIFPTDAERPLRFQDILDGTSNTLLLVSVAPDAAQIWTQPADWNVDDNDPLKGLTNEKRTTVVVAFADGSVHAFPVPISPEKMKAMISAKGGEIIEIR